MARWMPGATPIRSIAGLLQPCWTSNPGSEESKATAIFPCFKKLFDQKSKTPSNQRLRDLMKIEPYLIFN